ncbi:MAG TPA: hypothetical protein VF666_16070 [Pyrinomonadaceae bacterium]|jgi:hypothetical protein
MRRIFLPLHFLSRHSLLIISTCFLTHAHSAGATSAQEVSTILPSRTHAQTTSATIYESAAITHTPATSHADAVHSPLNSGGSAGIAAALIKELGKRERLERVRTLRDITIPEKFFAPRHRPRRKIS